MALLEREPYLSILEAALADVFAGAGRIALISGEAGMGKTSLVDAFISSHPRGVQVLWGACDLLFTPRPLGPLHDIAVQTHGSLSRLLAADANPMIIFSTLLVELQQRPTFIVFEDVHWADEVTLDLLRYIGRRIAKTQALLILTYRDDEMGPQHPLRMVLGDLAASPAARHIALPPLSGQAVQSLVGGRSIDAAALHHLTGGNPFFVTEVLGSASSGIPHTVRDAVLARAARLTASARAVLDSAAVIGPRIELWLLEQVQGMAVVDAAEECISVGMLVPQGDGTSGENVSAGSLCFRHELARETILSEISLLRKQALHRKILSILRAQPAEAALLNRLAHHAEGAEDQEAVLEYAPAAARLASKTGAHREAAQLYALALRYSGGLAEDECARILEAYAMECDFIGQINQGIAARRKAIELWRSQGNRLKEGENLAYLMNMLTLAGQKAEAQRVCLESIQILETLPPGRELALAYRVQAAACLVNRDCEEALMWAEKAMALAERLNDIEVLAAVHLTIGTATLLLHYERGCEYLESKIKTLHEAGLDARVAHIYSNLGAASGELYQFQRGQQYLAEGTAYAAEHDLDSHLMYMQAWQMMIDLYQGRWQNIDLRARQVLERPGVTVTARITALVALARLIVRRGDGDVGGEDAGALFDEALDLATQADTLQRLGPVRAARAEAAWQAGNNQRALEEAGAVYDLAVSKRHPWLTGELAFWRWRAGETVEVQAWMARPYALHISGDWQAAAAEWERLGCPYEQARALADGDTDAKIAALQIFEQLGARSAAASLRKELRSAGQFPLPRRPRAATRQNPFGLTSRQVEILALLIEGLNNATIASRLSISLKTADHHVTAILARLNVHTREDAASLARSHPRFKE